MGDTTAGSREGSEFGPYRLRRLVGRGGMGDVYEAEDTVRDRIVALKLMSETLSNDPVFRSRMQREARTAGRLQEPHVVPIHDFGEIDGQLYVDMRLIDGVDVASIVGRYGALSPARAVAIVRQVASALDAAHAAGVLHRDVKPENILVSADDFAYLVDFGIASATSDEKLTQIGTTVGTFKYMAPERFSDAAVTYRADIYALACVLYECLTGSPPYKGDQISVMGAHVNQAIPRPSAARPGIPVALDQVIACGMAKNPADRYASCGDLAVAAYAALASPDQDRATDILQRSQVANAPAAFAGPPSGGFTPAPITHASQPGTGWPAPSAPQPTPWTGAPVWSTGVATGPGAPPPWGQPARRGSRKPWLWVGVAAVVVVAVVGAVARFCPSVGAVDPDSGDDDNAGATAGRGRASRPRRRCIYRQRGGTDNHRRVQRTHVPAVRQLHQVVCQRYRHRGEQQKARGALSPAQLPRRQVAQQELFDPRGGRHLLRCGAERSEGLHRVLFRLVRQQLSAARGRCRRPHRQRAGPTGQNRRRRCERHRLHQVRR